LVNADSFRYFDNLYDPQIKFLNKYLIPMVIHFKRPDQIPLILCGDIRDLSQILHFPSGAKSGQKLCSCAAKKCRQPV
jgi:hypothetical protein